MMLKIAITGNIGSGKSTVCRIFESLNVPVFHADAEARALYQDPEVKLKVKELFGEDIYDTSGNLKKKKLAQIIFNDAIALKQINGLIHPLTLQRYEQWLADNRRFPYTLHESAILFENDLQNRFDHIINVSAPFELRLARVMAREKESDKAVVERMRNQLPDIEKDRLADFVIYNDEKQFLIPQVVVIDKQLRKLAHGRT